MTFEYFRSTPINCEILTRFANALCNWIWHTYPEADERYRRAIEGLDKPLYRVVIQRKGRRIIQRNAEAIGHVSPYKRIDPMHPGRKRVITKLEVMNGVCRELDPHLYRYEPFPCSRWVLKGGA